MTNERKDDEMDEAKTASPPKSGGEVRTFAARELLGARGMVRIEHEGEFYTLRITRNNRLILTK